MTKMILKVPFQVVCIDNKNKQDKIEDSEWIKEKETYIVTEVFGDILSGNSAFKLLGKDPYPFKGYTSDRFEAILSLHSVN